MSTTSRCSLCSLAVAGLIFASIVPAFAQEEGATTTVQEEGPGTTVGEEEAPTITIQPAVPAEEPPPQQEEPAWTYRYLIPTGLALAVLAVFVTVVQYFVRVVRNRYRVVK
ncbi:MAG: hypothetical protein ACRDVM_00115 [Acidimicrobiia bacterium]